MLLSSSPVMTQEHFSERCQGWRSLLEYLIIHHPPHETGQFPRNGSLGYICFGTRCDADVLPPEPVIRFVSISNDFWCISLLSLFQIGGLPSCSSEAIAVCRLCQQPAQMGVASFGDGKSVAGI